MANAVQCELRNELRDGCLISIRWVLKKKAVLGNRVTAYDFDEITTREWNVAIVYSNIEQDEKYLYHVVI